MKNTGAITFLESNQPLPDDRNLGDKIIVFDEVRKYLKENNDQHGFSLLISAFGDGFGVYQMVEDTASQYSPGVVIPIIKHNLSSSHRGVRYWNAQIAALFPDDTLTDELGNLLREDFDMRYASVTALRQIESLKAKSVLLETKLEKMMVKLSTWSITSDHGIG